MCAIVTDAYRSNECIQTLVQVGKRGGAENGYMNTSLFGNYQGGTPHKN